LKWGNSAKKGEAGWHFKNVSPEDSKFTFLNILSSYEIEYVMMLVSGLKAANPSIFFSTPYPKGDHFIHSQ
jgi:hypothetical protein